MKVYMITEAQMRDLLNRLELANLRNNNVISQRLTDQQLEALRETDLFRALNFAVHRWLGTVGGPPKAE